MLEQLVTGDFTSAIQQTMLGGNLGAEFTDPLRVPMTFTSTKRLRLLNPNYKSIKDADESAYIRAGLVSKSNPSTKTYNMSTMPMIEMAVNPHSIEWKQGKRQVKRDTQEGSVFFHFANSRGEDNDILQMTFRGNTGYINFRADAKTGGFLSTQSDSSPQTIKRLLLFHNLWNLTREEQLLGDGTPNEFSIIYNSPVIPTQIMLMGFFNTVLDWTDDGSKPFSKDYHFGFTVQETIPSLEDIIADLTLYMQDVGVNHP